MFQVEKILPKISILKVLAILRDRNQYMLFFNLEPIFEQFLPALLGFFFCGGLRFPFGEPEVFTEVGPILFLHEIGLVFPA